MTADNVIALPAPKVVRGADLERKVIGAVLFHQLDRAGMEALGVLVDDFADELCSKAWRVAWGLSGRREPVNAATIGAAGLRARFLTEAQASGFAELEQANVIDKPTLKRLARDLHLERQGDRTARSLEAEVQLIRSGQFDPSRTAGVLSGIERELQRAGAQVTDLTEDQNNLMARWDRNRLEGREEFLATGIKVLDAEIGGLPRHLCLISADAGVGKTALVDSMLHSMLLTHSTLVVGLVSPEDGVEHVPKRWLARETGWLLRDIGSRQMTPEEELKVQDAMERNHGLLKRILGYRERSITGDELITLCWQLVDKGAGAVFIDNFNKISLKDARADYHERVQRFSDRLAEFAEKARVPAVLVVHNTGDDTNQKGKVSASSGLQGGKALGRDARFRLDLFRKDKALRGIISKANELGEQGTVIEFNRQPTAGLIDPDTGERIDVRAEAAMERKARNDAIEAEAERRRKKRLAERAAEKARLEAEKLKAVEPPPQPELPLEEP